MSFVGKLGIGGRFRLAFAALLVAVLTVGAIGLYQAFEMNAVATDLARNRIPSIRTVGRLNAGVARYRQIQASLLLVSDADRAEIVDRMNQTVAEIEAAQRTYESLIDPGEEATVLYPAVLAAWQEYQRVSAPLTTPGIDLKAASTIYLNDIYPAFQKLRTAIQKDLDYNVSASDRGAQAAQAAFNGALWMTGGVTALAVALALIMAQWMNATVTRRVVHVSKGMRRLADRDYGFDLPTTSLHDEIGDMVRAIEACRTGLRAADATNAEKELEQAAKAARANRLEVLMRDFESKASQMVSVVSSAATELQSTAETMSGTAGRTADGAKTVATAASSASSNVQTVAAAAEELASSVSEITRQVTQSAGAANKACDQAAQTQTIVQKLAEAAERIGTVVSIISDIAGQTNLLALNATIEAARAGDAGKGFAVVASEVKTLASQTAKATDEIGTQIGQMQTATREAVSAIGSITGMIEQVSQTTAAIAAAIEEQGAATQEIARNVQQAATGTRDVSATIQDVGAAAQETGQGAQAISSAAHDLARQAEGLDGEMRTFLTGVRAA